MPKFVLKKQVFRLFSYGFYDILNQRIKNYTPMNIAFLVDGTKHEKKIKPKAKKYFNNARNQTYSTLVERNNVYSLDQGTFLILDSFVHVKDREEAIKGKAVKRYMLLAQFFDENEKPIFTVESTQSDISKVSTLHPDNKRLALAFMETVQDKSTTEVNNTLQVIQGPDHWINGLNGPWEYVKDE